LISIRFYALLIILPIFFILFYFIFQKCNFISFRSIFNLWIFFHRSFNRRL